MLITSQSKTALAYFLTHTVVAGIFPSNDWSHACTRCATMRSGVGQRDYCNTARRPVCSVCWL